jgi:putative membrane protein
MLDHPAGGDALSRPDTATRLAIENIALAQERTQLAWVQAGLAFISFGFSIAKAFQILHETRGESAPWIGARTIGILMVAIGLVFLVLASLQHWRAMKTLRRQYPDLPTSQAGVLAVLLAGLGIIALVGAILRS